MNRLNEPHGLNSFIRLDRLSSTEVVEMRQKCLRGLIDAAVAGVTTKRKYHVRTNRTQ